MPETDTYVLNLSFGRLIDKPYKFNWHFKELSPLIGGDANIEFELFNVAQQLENERELEKYHSLYNKQKLNYNPRASRQTGVLRVTYPDFKAEYSYQFTEQVGAFLHDVIAYMLGFFQRRRIIFGTPRLTSTEQFVYAMPPFLAGELIDSIGYGAPLIAYVDTECCMVKALNAFSKLSNANKDTILMLLRRYNETLNLPYTYERFEAFWRIIEALGNDATHTPAINLEYKRLLDVLKINRSLNLKSVVAAMRTYGVSYTDKDLIESRKGRNDIMHDYLDSSIIHDSSMADNFRFLKESVEFIIASMLSLDTSMIIKHNYTIIENRVF